MENLSLYDEVVVVAHFLLDLGDVLARETRNDTVNEGGADVVVFLKPVFESLVVSAEIIFPELDVLADAVFEVVSIEEDELARHENKTLGRIAVESLVAAEEQLHEFARIGRSRSVGELAAVIESDTCLGRVGDDETDFRLLCERHECPVLGVGVQRTRDDIDTLEAVDSLTVQTTLQVDMSHSTIPFSIGCTTATEPLKLVFAFMFHTIQSTKARRKLPSPNWIIFSGATLFGAVHLFNAFFAIVLSIK